jgi:hypothetical protein
LLRAPQIGGREKQHRSSFSDLRRPHSCRPRSAHHDLLIQLLIHDLDRAVDLGIGFAELMRNQFYQQIDALDERRAAGVTRRLWLMRDFMKMIEAWEASR